MRILFAWEMGHNYGHAAQIAAVARAMSRRGRDVWLALKNPAACMAFSKDFPGRILQAPYYPLRPGRTRRPPLTYAEGLIPCGYDSADNLYPLIESWRALYDLVKPNALVVQAAPTALLAARGLKFKRMAFGKGFDMPPLVAPMLPFQYWKKNDDDTIKRGEVEIINVINKALSRAGAKPIKKFSEMLETNKNFLCTFRELDHYPNREKAVYDGPLFETGEGEKIEWRKGEARRILAYVRPGRPVFGACVEALRKLPAGYDVILSAPGLPKEAKKKLETASFRIVHGPVRLDGLLKKCDLGVSHAGGGLANALALNGIPMLMLPLHIEQVMSARAVGRAGMGRALIGRIGPQHITEKINYLLSEKKYKEAAQRFAAQHKNFSPEKLAKKIADEIVKMI